MGVSNLPNHWRKFKRMCETHCVTSPQIWRQCLLHVPKLSSLWCSALCHLTVFAQHHYHHNSKSSVTSSLGCRGFGGSGLLALAGGRGILGRWSPRFSHLSRKGKQKRAMRRLANSPVWSPASCSSFLQRMVSNLWCSDNKKWRSIFDKKSVMK